jgi:hypothetical protein
MTSRPFDRLVLPRSANTFLCQRNPLIRSNFAILTVEDESCLHDAHPELAAG